MKDLSCAQKRVLWHMANGWQLRQIFKADNSIHWRLVCGGKPENGSFRIRSATIHVLGMDVALINTDGTLHNRCYRIFTLTPEGAETAKTISRMDFE